MVSLELEARLDNLLSTAQAETANIDLFAPITEREECPICLLPLPIIENESAFMQCCGKTICAGCVYRHFLTDIKNGGGQCDDDSLKCAFCRQLPLPTNPIKKVKKLMKKNHPEAFLQMADKYESGEGVLQSNTRALELYTRSAELGFFEAFVHIGRHYYTGTVVEKDVSKVLAFYEVAAKKGSIYAHRWLALFHKSERNEDQHKSIEHLKVAASAGDKDSMDDLMKMYKYKLLSKEELTRTLRACQASQNEVKSKERDNARLIDESRRRGEAPPAHLLSEFEK